MSGPGGSYTILVLDELFYRGYIERKVRRTLSWPMEVLIKVLWAHYSFREKSEADVG